MTGFATLAELGRGGVFTDGDWVESKDQDPTGSVRLTQLADVGVGKFRNRSDRWMRVDQAQRLNCTYLRPDDVLIARMPDPIGRACLVPEAVDRAVTAVDVAILRLDTSTVMPAYVMWMINAPQFNGRVEALQSGTTRERISRKNLSSLTIPLPELAEQRRVIEAVEAHLTRLDAAEISMVLSRQRAVSMVASARHRMMEQARVGTETRTIGEIASVGTGTTPSRSQPRYYEGGAIPWITSGDLSQGLIERATQFVTADALAETSLKLYPSGTLLVAMYGEGKTRGTVAELALSAATNQACAAVQVPDGELRPWVRAVLDANYTNMRRLAAGGVQPNLNLGLVRGIPIPIPDSVERSRLLAEMEQSLEGAKALTRDVDRVVNRLAALRRAVLAAAFRGELTGRRTDDEVIEELAGVGV